MRLPKIPKSVTILGRKLKVKFMSRDKMDNRCDGKCFYAKRLILISDDLTKEETFVTFMHEVCHAADFITGMSQAVDSNLWEILVESHSAAFYDVLKSMR